MRGRSGAGRGTVGPIRRFLFLESLLVVGSVAAAYLLHWRIPLPVWFAVPTGVVLWLGGLLSILRLRKRRVRRRGTGMRGSRRGYPLVETRGVMHLGMALGFRSWPTLALAALLFGVNLTLAARVRRTLLKTRSHE